MNQNAILDRWTEADVEQLVRLLEAGLSFRDLMKQLRCSAAELEQKAFYLGLLLPKREPTRLLTLRTASSGAVPSAHTYFAAVTVPPRAHSPVAH